MNILSTQIDNNSKVKEILRKHAENLDAAKNIYLFGKQFEGKLPKITLEKQKSKSFWLAYRKDQEIIIVQHQNMIANLFKQILCLKIIKEEEQWKDRYLAEQLLALIKLFLQSRNFSDCDF